MASGGGVIVRFYRFKNRLKEKTAGLSPGRTSINMDTLEKAQDALNKMAEDYPDWVSNLIVKLQEQHGRCVDTPESRRDSLDVIQTISHDMKGQGGTFGYPLITEFADSLYAISAPRDDISDNRIELIKSHIDAMRAVIKGRVSGDGGDIGRQLTKSLNDAKEKYAEE